MATGMMEIPPLTVLYQPVIDLNSGQVAGAEALLRFIRADGSLVSPIVDGVIERIEAEPRTLQVLTEQIFECIAKDAVPVFRRRPKFYVGVNIPPVILGCGAINRIHEMYQLDSYANRLVCEVTERQALSEEGRLALNRAHDEGIRIAIDDFGTGESQLKQLIGLQFDILKIDKSHVQPLMKDPTADRLLRGMVALAGALRVKLTAEGVETREQAFFLRAAGIDCGQGWYWSGANSMQDFSQLLDAGFLDKQAWI